MTTHVAICLSDSSGTYYKHALVTAASILDNAKGGICLHVVHDETLIPTAEEAFRNLCAGYNQQLVLHRVGDLPEGTARNVPPAFGRGAMYKMMLPELISEGKVLYLDCDTVCTCDVADIYAHDVSQKYLGAVKMGRKQGLKWCKMLGLKSNFCINSGVMLLNLDKIRKEIPRYTEDLLSVVKDWKKPIGDQEAISIFFDGNGEAYSFLPEACNFRIEQEDKATLPLPDYQGKILHFAGKKPWQVFSAPAVYYWKYYAMLFPQENVFEQMERLQPYEYAHLFSFIMRHEQLRRWVNRLFLIQQNGLWSTLMDRILPGSRGKEHHE